MKKTKNLLTVLLTGVILFSGCSNPVTGETGTTDTNESPETEFSTEVLEIIPAKHEISIEDVQSILAANDLRTNYTKFYPYPGYHGGQQMRVVHTERGTYTAFVKTLGDETGIQNYYVAKIDNDHQVTLLHYGEFTSDKNEVLLNIAQDTNGDILVAITSHVELEILVFDHETDAMTKYASTAVFSSGETPKYTQAMFDFANRKIYAFYNGGMGTGNYLLEWITFDMENKEWSDNSIYTRIEGIGRHCYLYPFPDGNGGAYIVGKRADTISLAENLVHADVHKYVWDNIRLFHIPDLTSAENITHTMVQDAYSEKADEGIWNEVSIGYYGNVFMDKDGYLHIIYRNSLQDLSDESAPYLQTDYHHAVYDDMDCVSNEKITLQTEQYPYYKAHIMQSTDGTLYMIACKQHTLPLEIEIYKADDALGQSWTYQTTKYIEAVTTPSFSISAVRDGSIQDNIISCFVYQYDGLRTGFTFNLSLDDYSVTNPVDILAEYDLQIDERMDKRAYNSGHQTKVVHTENGTYAAFVYDYNYYEEMEYFHIVKMDKDGKISVLYSDGYYSLQNKYLTIQRLGNGQIYVCPPTGNTVYTIDPTTDAVTLYKTTDKRVPGMMIPQQTDIITDPETDSVYVVSVMDPTYFSISYQMLDTETMTVSKSSTKYKAESNPDGAYSQFYTVSDHQGGIYLIGTKQVTREYLADKLNYSGHIVTFNDSIMLHYVPVLTEGNMSCIEIQVPYEAEGNEGIWSVVNVADSGDVYLDAEGKLHIFYTYYHFDFDDVDRKDNPILIANTLKHYHAIYDGSTLVSNEEIGIAGLTKDTSIRMAETVDGTPYLLVCNVGEANARIDVYSQTENGWALSQTKELGEFSAESFSISGPRGGSVQDNTVDCIIYGMDNDVYYTAVTFK
ncbi:MAG: hypothetical protein E7658_02875 [Ruminococcaceae bacterium]|nr:hypothetical protein [Oscillospiraceae bacterium]